MSTGLVSLTGRLTTARLKARQGDGILFLASIGAFALSTALALTVAGGTWMFVERWHNPRGIAADIMAIDPTFEVMLIFYVGLALMACALLIPSIVSLVSSSAMLGARGRERRLSALRLLGLSSGDITRMSFLESITQGLIGTAIGVVLYFVTLPFWTRFSFLDVGVEYHELVLPWWIAIAVVAATLIVALCAVWLGMRRVRITPLGVSRRSAPAGLKWWRAIVFAVMLAVYFIVSAVQAPNSTSEAKPLIIIAMVLFGAISAISLVGPIILQLVSKAVALGARRPAVLWSARRIQFDPKSAWRRSAGMMLLALVAALAGYSPVVYTEEGTDADFLTIATIIPRDITTGALIVLVVGLVLAAASLFISQASEVLERADESISLTRMGAPRTFIAAASWLQSLGPIVLGVAIGGGLGWLMGLSISMDIPKDYQSGIGTFLIVTGGGIILSLAAVAATLPLQQRLLELSVRPND